MDPIPLPAGGPSVARVPIPLLPVAAGAVLGLGIAPDLGSSGWAAWVLGFLLTLGAAALPRPSRGLSVFAGFLLLGLARGAPPEPPPERLLGRAAGPHVWELALTAAPSSGRAAPSAAVGLAAWSEGPHSAGDPPRWAGRLPLRLSVPAWPRWPAAPARGQRWLVRGRLDAAADGDGDRRPWLRVGSAWDLAPLNDRTPPFARVLGSVDRMLAAARHRVERAIDQGSGPDVRPLFAALVLNERAELDAPLVEAFARTATTHLLAISGSHVVTVMVVVIAVLEPLILRVMQREAIEWALAGDARRVATVLGVAVAAFYVVLAGAPDSARRALVMLVVLAAGTLGDRPAPGWNALAASALLVTWLDPPAARSLGLHLSLASVAGLLALLPAVSRWTCRWPRPLRALAQLLGASVAGSLATAPLSAWAWGQVPLAGIWANVLAVPLLGTLALPPALAGAALGALHPELGAPWFALAAIPARIGLAWVRWAGEPSRAPLVRMEIATGAVVAAALLSVAILTALPPRARTAAKGRPEPRP